MKTFRLENYLFKVCSVGQLIPEWRLYDQCLSVPVNVCHKGPNVLTFEKDFTQWRM